MSDINVCKPQYPCEAIIKRYTLSNTNGLYIQVIDYGATVTAIRMKDKVGLEDDIVLGFETIEGKSDVH